MGCADSILSAVASRHNEIATTQNDTAQPINVKVEKMGREEAKLRRQRMVAERHAKNQSMAKAISDQAMADRERLSWRSWPSETNGYVATPTVSISVRGSDGTGSPDNNFNSASSQVLGAFPDETSPEDVHTKDMERRTIELPNQVSEELELHANHGASLPPLGVIKDVESDEKTVDSSHFIGHRSDHENDSGSESNKTSGCGRVDTSIGDPIDKKEHRGNMRRPADATENPDDVSRTQSTERQGARKGQAKGKSRGKNKAVKFEDLEEGVESVRKSTSQGR
ncbi:uncharacterized protein [Diadema antillarum]|uniref:uncharacterized protein n=1 Tax=Diadema antillarum TaxID=105358 RepID=UPI003A88565E